MNEMGKSEFEQVSFFEKLYLKIADRKQYTKYKYWLAEQKWKATVDNYLQKHHQESYKSIDDLKKLSTINVLHSGNAGDIIYSLPTIKKIFELTHRKCNYLLRIDQPHNIGEQYDHPLGGVMLNKEIAAMLQPLLVAQPYIESCDIFINQTIDINLDNFRKIGLMLDRGDISRWCGYITGVVPDVYKPWLEVEPDDRYNKAIVINRSSRYRNPNLDYAFLRRYGQIYFIGIRSEYDDIKAFIPNIKWIEVDHFLQLAQIIRGCDVFIGNQSFPFSVAEALKVPRVLEMCVFTPNVIPQGEHGHDVYFQSHFESTVKSLTNV
jgi:hypothetical protein